MTNRIEKKCNTIKEILQKVFFQDWINEASQKQTSLLNINIPKKKIRQQNKDSDTDSTQAFKFINNTSLKNISSDKDLYQDVNKILLKENQDKSTRSNESRISKTIEKRTISCLTVSIQKLEIPKDVFNRKLLQ